MTTVTASETRPKIACAECQRINDCDCLSQLRLLDLLAPPVRQLLDHVLTDGSVMGDEVTDQIALLLDRDDQRKRENAAIPEYGDPEDARSDQGLVEDVIGSWGYEPSFRRDAEGIAALRKVPVEHVRALVDRFLADSRPAPLPECPCGEGRNPLHAFLDCGQPPAPPPAPPMPDRYELLAAAARRLHVDGSDPARTGKSRAEVRRLARHRMRALLGIPDPSQTPPPARETWPAWAREVDAAVERRAA
jgi:hypothetical protein